MCINTGEVEIAGLSDEKQNQVLKVHTFSARVSYTCTYTYYSCFDTYYSRFVDRSAKIMRTKQTASKPVLFYFLHLFQFLF